LFVETPSSTSPPGVPFLTTGQQPSVNEELNTELHNLMEYDVSSSVSAVHAFTGVGGFSYLKYKHSKQQQLAQLLIARNEALLPSSLHKMFHLYVQGIPPDSAAGRWAKNNKHFLKEALLCAMRNAAVHNPDKLPKCLMTVHPDGCSINTCESE
jgi:hypothetical protein